MKPSNKEKYWRRVLEAFAQSGMTPKEFCASRTLTIKSFYHWRKRLWQGMGQPQPGDGDGARSLQLIPVDLKTDTAPPLPSGVRMDIDGVGIQLDRGFDADTLGRVLALLKRGAPC